MTREEWLTKAATDYIFPMLAEHAGATPIAWRVSVGFPGGGSARKRVGECWPTECSTDEHVEMFISPILSTATDCLGVLVHECVHASVGCAVGHKGPFKRLALAAGLEGKMTATVPGVALSQRIAQWISELPAFPFASIVRPDKGKKGSRLLKATCETCGYTVRVTRKWLDAVGPPTCGDASHGAMLVDGAPGGEGATETQE